MKKFLIFVWIVLHPSFSIFAQRDLMQQHYGPAAQNTLDLYLPELINLETPVVIMLHGGAWMMGGNEYTAKTARDLRDRGFVVANVDYRYVSKSIHAKDLLADIDKAVQFVSSAANTYHFKKSGYHLSGVSAGAHLALLYGYTTQRKVKSIAVLCAPSRLDDPKELAFIRNLNLLHNIELLADAKYQPGKKLDPKFTDVSPYAHIKNIPTLLFHGDKDELVPYRVSVSMIAHLKAKHVATELITMPGKAHDCGMNQADSEKIVLDNIVDWVRKYD